MIKNLVSTVGATIVALGLMSLNSQAATLDFTTNPFVGANGNFAGTTYAISATGGSLYSSQGQDGNTCVGLACTTDGLGVNNGTGGFEDDDDEISSRGSGQSITINFGQQILITGLSFLDLFMDDDSDNREVARVTYNGGVMDFLSDPNQVRFDGSSGFLMINGLNLFTDQLIFTVFNGGLQDRGYGDYALASIVGVSAVPLPPALLMFGAAFSGLGFMVRRRKKALEA
jgi:hypothetical protein